MCFPKNKQTTVATYFRCRFQLFLQTTLVSLGGGHFGQNPGEGGYFDEWSYCHMYITNMCM